MQLLALAGTHFVIDLFAGMPPAILPAILDKFSLSLSRGSFVLVALYLVCNGVQVFTGHVRSGKRQPLLLHIGLLLGSVICLLGLLPRGVGAFPGMVFLAVVSGIGIALVHPEGLRGVHRLKRISPAVSTAVFMAGGFLGYASGGAVSAYLVSRFGFRGLCPLILCSLVSIATVILLRIRLAVEPKTEGQPLNRPSPRLRSGQALLDRHLSLPFWLIFAMAMPAAVSTTILSILLPTALHELGFELTFGGFSTTMFGLGGAVGSFVWAYLARKKGELPCTVTALFLNLPFLLAYLLLKQNRAAIWILLGIGFCTVSAYTLMITLSRHATGPTLGRRLGIMVGGTWALAYVIFMGLPLIAERFKLGTNALINLTPWGYLCSGIFGLYVMFKVRPARRSDGGR
jgi:FSR family fosmidomycin resistance protein-like MFS transporter